jgi:hypothetical protein
MFSRANPVARKIKEYNGTKIILISAYSLDDLLLKELEESKCIAKYVKKPIQLSSRERDNT